MDPSDSIVLCLSQSFAAASPGLPPPNLTPPSISRRAHLRCRQPPSLRVDLSNAAFPESSVVFPLWLGIGGVLHLFPSSGTFFSAAVPLTPLTLCVCSGGGVEMTSGVFERVFVVFV